jgi:hypothetical protein
MGLYGFNSNSEGMGVGLIVIVRVSGFNSNSAVIYMGLYGFIWVSYLVHRPLSVVLLLEHLLLLPLHHLWYGSGLNSNIRCMEVG